jgi:D-alanyl-lipoteichoic acid acyltransferase DltB (MBOAT superfamily)
MPSFDIQAFFEQFLYDPGNPLLFNNGFFVLFFAIFIALYYQFRNNFRIRRYIFCFFSLYFFYKASGYFVALVIISAGVDFIVSNAIYSQKNKIKKKLLLVSSIVFNLGMLVYFKYTNFFISLSNDLFTTGFNPLNILLPVGISFYTFENLSYTIDVYRGQFEPTRRFSDYLLFLAFFPKLVMGPIVRAHDFLPQINKPYVITEKDFAKGFYLIISGMFKKLIISDYLTLNYVNYIFDDPSRHTGLENLFAVYGYAIVIYCDFSGYSDVALGIARWMGFSIPTNFLSPYQSKSITEFWRRWHISLSSWLRDYLYIPLGGNRKASFGTFLFAALFVFGVIMAGVHLMGLSYIGAGLISVGIIFLFILPSVLKKDRAGVSTNLNLLATMLLGGFWHGASWNFIIWGALHGIGLAIHKIWMLVTGKAFSGFNNKTWYNAIALIITFHFVCLGWIFFKAENFETATTMIHQIRYNFSFDVWEAFYGNYQSVIWMMLLAFILHAIPDNYADKLLDRYNRVPLVGYLTIFFLFVLLYGYFKAAEPVMPIYLQF